MKINRDKYNDMDESWKPYVEQKKLNIKDYIVYESIYEILKQAKLIHSDKENQ